MVFIHRVFFRRICSFNAGFRPRSGPSLGVPVGPLPAQLRRLRPLSATSAKRRLQPAGMRK